MFGYANLRLEEIPAMVDAIVTVIRANISRQ
jgi:hypothetical protein